MNSIITKLQGLRSNALKCLMLSVLGCAVMLAATGCAYFGGTTHIAISKDDMQSALSRRIDQRRKVMGMFELQLSDSAVSLDSGKQRVLIASKIRLEDPLTERGMGGVARMSSLWVPSADGRQVLLKEPKVDGFESDARDDLSTLSRKAILFFLEQTLEGYPIYTLPPDKADALKIQSIEVKSDGIRLALVKR